MGGRDILNARKAFVNVADMAWRLLRSIDASVWVPDCPVNNDKKLGELLRVSSKFVGA